jgi:hypothetical protein
MHSKRLLSSAAVIAALLPTAAGAAVTEGTFELRTTADLVELCTVAPTDSMGTAAINFCHGFAVGVYRVLEKENAARRTGHLFCIPETNRPTRNQALADFVQWAKGSPNVMSQQPADSIALYIETKYPCPGGR